MTAPVIPICFALDVGIDGLGAVPAGTATVNVVDAPGFGRGRSRLFGLSGRVIRVGRERSDLIGAPHPQRHRGEDFLELNAVDGSEQAKRAPFARLQRRAP